jgi:EAL and modified HD-GYP domain-containing signal transduction protein
MNTPTSPAFVYFELLADRNKTPSALLLSATSDPTGLFLKFAQDEHFRTLCSALPCLLPELPNLPAVFVEAATAAGCKFIPADQIHRANSLAAPVPPEANWIGGFWYMAPPAKPTGAQAASRALALQLVQLVSADADTHEIEAVLRRDPTLSYHLLKVVNSLGMGMSRQITSFSQAILILGRAQLRRWLNLMLFSSRQGDERSAMLLARVAIRARAMELLAKASGMDKATQDAAFMTGMFSLLGVLFGMPLPEVLKPLKISEALQAALLERKGNLGQLLQAAECAELRDTANLLPALDALQVPAAEFPALLVEAHAWMSDVIKENRGAANA